MIIGKKTVLTAVVTDENSRVLMAITDENTITTKGINFLFEEKEGDICFIPMDDGSVRALYRQENVSMPICAMNSEEFAKRAKAEPTDTVKTEENEEVKEPETKEVPKEKTEGIPPNGVIVGQSPVDISKVLGNLPPDALMTIVSSLASIASKGDNKTVEDKKEEQKEEPAQE